MADVSSTKFLDKSYNERARAREKNKDYVSSSHSKKYDRDMKYESPTSGRKEPTSKDGKYISYDRGVEDRNSYTSRSTDERRVSYRSEDKNRYTETSHRYDNHRGSSSLENDRSQRFSESSQRYDRHPVKNDGARIPIPSEDDKCRYSENSHRFGRHEAKNDVRHNSTSNDEMRPVGYPDSFRRYDRYDNHRNPSHADDRFPGDRPPRRTSLNAERYEGRTESNERHVSYNNNHGVSNDSEHVSSLWQKIDFLSNQVDTLSQENEKLKCCLSGNKNKLDDSSAAEVNIFFFNKNLEEIFLPTIQEITSNLIQGKLSVIELQDFLASKKSLLDKQEEAGEDWTALPEGDLFSLDNSTTEPTDTPYVPQYESSFCEILQDEDLKNPNKAGKSQVKRKNIKFCFNCSGEHVISKCPYEINPQRVAFAKKQRPRPFYASTVRYHVQGVKESDFKPGVISDELRSALGLEADQIPQYIYRMRLLNYPPGWLEEAAVESSGIALYGSDGYAQSTENNGELKSNGMSVQYDPDKLVDFPGFNVPLPPDMIDESYQLGLPAMQSYHLRSVVEQNMSKPDVCPKRKRKFYQQDDNSVKIPRLDEDMDVEELEEVSLEFNPPLPEDAPPPPPPDETPPPLPLDAPPPDEEIEPTFSPVIDSDSRSGTDTPMSDSIMEVIGPVVERFQMKDDTALDRMSSPSLKVLEEIKKRLVMELGFELGPSSPAIPDAEENDSTNPCDFSPAGDVHQESGNDLSSFSDCSFTSNPNTPPLQRTESGGSASKFVMLGTPSLSRHSSFRKLPDYDNFAKDVTSHLNFENLPNSTGAYERMKKVMKKVKEKINSLMQ